MALSKRPRARHNAGVAATARKEEIQRFIKDQMDLGGKGLDKRDHYLLEINLKDLETSSGEDHHYWLLQIKAARRDLALIEENRNRIAVEQHRGEELHNYFSF